MSLPRQHRRWLSIGLLVTLLFTQWTTAAHACAAPAAPPAAYGTPPCEGHAEPGGESLQVCKAHCEQSRQAVHNTQTADFDTPPVLLAVVDWAAAACVAAPQASALRDPGLPPGTAPPGSPPLYLSLHVLRN